VERFFGIITQKAIRRGSLPSVGERTHKINDFVEPCNTQARPFVWVAIAESTLAKIQRLCKAISRTRHQVLWTNGIAMEAGVCFSLEGWRLP